MIGLKGFGGVEGSGLPKGMNFPGTCSGVI